MNLLRIISLCFSIVLLTSCASKTPDLERIYKLTSAQETQPPIVFIPGILGTRLKKIDTGKEVWPGGLFKLIFGSYSDLQLKIDPLTLTPDFSGDTAYRLFETYGDEDFYRNILDTLSRIGEFEIVRRREGSLPPANRRVYVFLYDWRKDLVNVAAELDQFIEDIRSDYDDPKLKVDLLAHSMGGLITRYFVRYGKRDVLNLNSFEANFEGAQKVRRAILIATPNLGSVKALQSFMMGHKVGYAKIEAPTLWTAPSAYQLLPHPDEDWMIQIDGQLMKRGLYSIDTWKDYQWGIYHPNVRRAYPDWQSMEKFFAKHLRRGRNFHRSISRPEQFPGNFHYILFGGDCHLTPARCLIEEVNGQMLVRLHPKEIKTKMPEVNYEELMLEPGDKAVTKPSLLGLDTLDPVRSRPQVSFPLAYSVFVCSPHETIASDITFQDNLLNVLLRQKTTLDRLLETHRFQEGGKLD